MGEKIAAELSETEQSGQLLPPRLNPVKLKPCAFKVCADRESRALFLHHSMAAAVGADGR